VDESIFPYTPFYFFARSLKRSFYPWLGWDDHKGECRQSRSQDKEES
jgi:hypothetical protein